MLQKALKKISDDSVLSITFAFEQGLRLCLEPEAACLTVENHHHNIRKWETGMKLMVLDCGGGTIDITTHSVVSTDPLGLKELEEPAGGPWGSTMADEKFKHFLKVRDELQNALPSSYRGYRRSFPSQYTTNHQSEVEPQVSVSCARYGYLSVLQSRFSQTD